jgi:hypothetical protein
MGYARTTGGIASRKRLKFKGKPDIENMVWPV